MSHTSESCHARESHVACFCVGFSVWDSQVRPFEGCIRTHIHTLTHTHEYTQGTTETYTYNKRPAKEIYKRDVQRDLQKRSTRETLAFAYRDVHLSQNTCKRNLQKKLTKETYKKDPQK